MSWLLDADVLSQPVKTRGNPRVIAWLKREQEHAFTSSIVIAQVAFWVRRIVPDWDKEKQQFLPVTEANITLSFDHRVLDGGAGAGSFRASARCSRRRRDCRPPEFLVHERHERHEKGDGWKAAICQRITRIGTNFCRPPGGRASW